MITRQVTWGDAIVVLLFRQPGGLRRSVDIIRAELGDMIGTRNTFAKLLRADDPSTLSDRDKFRAWLLLTTLGEAPAEWSIPDEAVPHAYDRERLIETLTVGRVGLEPTTDGSWVSDFVPDHVYYLPDTLPA